MSYHYLAIYCWDNSSNETDTTVCQMGTQAVVDLYIILPFDVEPHLNCCNEDRSQQEPDGKGDQIHWMQVVDEG